MADVEKVGGLGKVKSISCGATQPQEHSKNKEEAKRIQRGKKKWDMTDDTAELLTVKQQFALGRRVPKR